MQEARYCEDIIAQIKADLSRRGYVNEHDRLGHFEAKVPLDILLALAKRNTDAKFFGIQIKAPSNRRLGTSWNLTATPQQYQAIVKRWPSFIIYGLPWYDAPAQAPEALNSTCFVLPKNLPSKHVFVLDSDAPMPDDFVLDLALAFVGPFDVRVSEIAHKIGLQEFARRMRICSEADPIRWIAKRDSHAYNEQGA